MWGKTRPPKRHRAQTEKPGVMGPGLRRDDGGDPARQRLARAAHGMSPGEAGLDRRTACARVKAGPISRIGCVANCHTLCYSCLRRVQSGPGDGINGKLSAVEYLHPHFEILLSVLAKG